MPSAAAEPATVTDPAARIDVGMRDAVLTWFDAHGRDLAFRRTRDPYGVLVSELMAQQTQIGRATEAWIAWMARFPTVQALADATPADVLRQWQGLGYNRRALNLHRAARAIVEDHDGVVPDTVAELRALPGIGPYTARAVAAIAFGRREGAVDTNVRRVLGRAVAGDPSRLTAMELQAVADDAVPHDRPGAWTHALMDVGATFCRPATPRCGACPLERWCRFAAAPTVPRPRARHGTSTETRFTSTSRWLRGRIVDRVRAADGWTAFDDPIGEHDAQAVGRALDALAREGLVELRARGGHREARLPLA